ncbi:hypothetical protein [Endozoicomonas sp. SCSIO W0465]|uniref:hypothetical protein n=1 Tax=Endozoicomonas sp. SCSIO W0465 TaxID=2918516 RepID=UPI00207598B3|nr:hypothetical protein [Endozoicomonas sp. SCSIO W0465]USE36329.1 hypothetical protein MJO57_30605 [Endozoicomonas sp. SCSIO W0465]
MIKIEKYKLKDGETGWKAHFQLEEGDTSDTVHTRRFSCARYGGQAFHKALEWIERQYYRPETAAFDKVPGKDNSEKFTQG